MTCIAAVSDGARVYLGGDSALSVGDHIYMTADPKVYAREGVVLGFCGTLRFGQLIALTPLPPLRAGADADLWVRREVCRALQQAARDRGFELGSDDDSEAILGVGGQIYVLDPGAVAYRPAGNYAAIGSGAAWAEGSLHTSKGTPRRRLTLALEAAEAHCGSVRRPWVFASG